MSPSDRPSSPSEKLRWDASENEVWERASHRWREQEITAWSSLITAVAVELADARVSHALSERPPLDREALAKVLSEQIDLEGETGSWLTVADAIIAHFSPPAASTEAAR